MKKFLIAIIVLIPLVVVLALSATGAIISATVSVNVESLFLLDSNDNELDLNKTYTMDLIGGYMDLLIIAIPTISYNSEVSYRFTEDSVGEVTLQKIEGRRYRITPVEDKPGAVSLVIFAQNNINANKRINIYITTDRLKDFDLVTENNQTPLSYLSITENVQLHANCYPVESIGNNFISYSSSNPDNIDVDANGFLTINKRGISEITASVLDKAGTLHTASVIVDSNEAVVKEKIIYLHNYNNNQDWISENIIVNPDFYITESNNLIDYTLYRLNNGDNIKVFETTDYEWDILNKEFFKNIYLDNGGYKLTAAYTDYAKKDERFDITFTSNNTDIISIDNEGKLLCMRQGIAVITVFALGVEKEIEINVNARANTFMLDLNNEDNKVGLKQERLWAINFINTSLNPVSYIQQYQFGYKESSATYNGEVISNFNLKWEIEDESLASIDEYGLITFYEEAAGQEVKVIATELVHGIKTRLSRSYVFLFIDNKDAVNLFEKDISLHSNIVTHLSRALGLPVVLHTNISANRRIDLGNSLYGNGHKIDATHWEEHISTSRPIIDLFEPNFKDGLEELTLENFVLTGMELPENFNNDLSIFKSRLIGIKLNELSSDMPIVFRYLDIRYLHDGIYFGSSNNLSIEGSILGDCFGASINVIQIKSYDNSYINLKNIVFKVSNSPSMMLSNGGITPQGEEANNPELMKERLKGNYLPRITIDGFIDNYNWKRQNQLSSIFSLFEESWFDDIGFITYDTFISYLSNILEELFERPEYSNLLYRDEKGVKWVSMMGFATGLWANINPDVIEINNDDYTVLNMHMPSSGVIGLVLVGLSQYLGIKSDNTCYIISYDFKDNAPDILPNQPCPNDQALLNRLQGIDINN